MAELLSLRGRNALSPFRVTKLLSNLAGTRISGFTADFWHFVQLQRELTRAERETLDRVLTYGPRSAEHGDAGELLLVIPRPGTISPWASKATDIAHNCGLTAVSCIERGIAYRVTTRDDGPLTDAERAALVSHIHDRMTEAVFPSLADATRLFRHFAPGPLGTIELGADGCAALAEANRSLGLALSADEID